MKRILCYGDSNTYGHDPLHYNEILEKYERFPEDVRWPGVMANLLGSQYKVWEAGLCGRTTAFDDPDTVTRNGLNCLEMIIQTCDPIDCIIFMLGTNDTKIIFDLSAEQITDGMEKLIKLAKEIFADSRSRNTKIILACPVKVTSDDKGIYWYEMCEESTSRGERMRKLYKELAQKYDCVFFDVNDVARVSSADGVHFDADGHYSVGVALGNLVKKVLDEE